ncbi:MAG: hydantoinase B/oxoprolinase family protein [Synechococcaceae cyanobacterium]|nr:hydantoinase B/oxoprolinase family protein [Synechococcaceae cyanobacterium]
MDRPDPSRLDTAAVDPEPHAGGWHFWIDRGGTFTDLVARSPQGALQVRKVLSRRPGRFADPAVAAIRAVLGLAEGATIPAGWIEEVRLGTTVATNALLERATAPVLLLVTRGFADLLRIGDQHRPEIFALQIRPAPLPSLRVLEIDGRIDAEGREIEPLRLDAALAAEVQEAVAAGFASVAVALLHSSRHPAHERAVGTWLASLGVAAPLLSHRVSPQPRLVPRGTTCLVEAAIAPVLHAYLAQVQQELGPQTRLRVMTSAGALQAPSLLLAKDTILSGPAGGLVGAVAAARLAGLADGPILGFDMGGTSTDVFHCVAQGAAEENGGAGERAGERSRETEIVGLRILAPMLPIHTVAAGGGSVLAVRDGRLTVGPRSAGAVPGPACYGNGGPLTLTDANVLLGRLPVVALPAVFGPGGDGTADRSVVRRGFAELVASLAGGAPGSDAITPEALADGAVAIAVDRMAEAIRRVSIQRGHDIRGALLVSFGGAGGLHACALAARLGIARVLLPPLAGVLSAWGIGLARHQLLREHSLGSALAEPLLPELAALANGLEAAATADLRATGDLAPTQAPVVRRRLELRLAGRDRGLEIKGPEPGDDAGALRRRFEALYQQRFGHGVAGEELVVERLWVEVGAPAELPLAPRLEGAWSAAGSGAPALAEPAHTPVCLPADDGSGLAWRSVPLRRRAQLAPGQRLAGPAVVMDDTGTLLLEPHWHALCLAGGGLLLERGPVAPAAGVAPAGEVAAMAADPVRLELYNHRFTAIAEQMGVRLQQSARSVNIRERLDFSCALFDGAGRLVANAPHIPVHLGSMGESVAALLDAVARGALSPPGPGDAIAANDPFHGGTHLPDITVITPVFAPTAPGAARAPLVYLACRGHHADVGGITPGSMPPFSRSLAEEGLLLTNVPLLVGGVLQEEAWRRRLAAGPHPVRNPDQLLADLQAQIAANRLGAEELQRLLDREGAAEVVAYMAHVQANAAEAVRHAIAGLHDGAHTVELDDGARIQVLVRIDHARRRARVDFSGTSPQQPGNRNAPLAITRAVVLYVFRCLVGEAIPLNAGCFAPIDLVVPEGCLLHPRPPAAVVAGNVETSQAVANALFGALGVMAAAQGTMNNLSFGDAHHQYYETICGGTGAGVRPDGRVFDGADAVQSHMTNSRLTDPEVLEARFPVRLERFALRRGSGGAGRGRGGDGVVRELRFLAPMTAAILSGSRRVPPFGLAGGAAGHVGRNLVARGGTGWEELPGCAELAVEPGDRLRIETPGGGGYGSPPEET